MIQKVSSSLIGVNLLQEINQQRAARGAFPSAPSPEGKLSRPCGSVGNRITSEETHSKQEQFLW
jgi:hypothetical protein